MTKSNPMTQEREAAILEKIVSFCGEKDNISSSVAALSDLADGLDKHLTGKATTQEVMPLLGRACVEINLLQLILGDATEFEVAELERMEGLIQRGVR